jgi:glycosyltransferase involved in cell wall biosynthesis
VRISVAIATFNGERFLREQLDSIARQSRLPDELVACDDGSTDATLAILHDFADGSPFPVHVRVNESRLGFADTFLTAAGRCSGDLVTFSDQDDVWHEDKLRRAVDAFAPGVVLAVHNCVVADADLTPTGQIFPGIKRRTVAEPLTSDKWFHMPGMAMVFSRQLLRVADPRARPRSHFLPNEMVFHDEWIHVLAQVCGRIAFLPDRLAYYRQHGANVTGAPSEGLVHVARSTMSTGLAYYTARSEQARDWEELFGRLARRESDAALRARFERGSDFFGRVAAGLAHRVRVYEGKGRRARSASLIRGLLGGGYGRRLRGGSGLRGLSRDAVMIALGRGG